MAFAFNSPIFGYNTAWEGARAMGLHAGAAPPGALVFFRPDQSNGYAGHVGIALPGNQMISAQSNGVQVAGLSLAYWQRLYAGWAPAPSRWPGRPPSGAGPKLVQPTASPTAPSPSPSPSPPPAAKLVNRTEITSYNRVHPGAPYSGQFMYAFQQFTAASNTVTQLGVTIGNLAFPDGASPYSVLIRLCSNQPDSSGNCNTLGQTTPSVINYGATEGDIGDVGVTPGASYWVVYYPPQPYGSGWVTYWWAGGSDIASSDQVQVLVRGYNR